MGITTKYPVCNELGMYIITKKSLSVKDFQAFFVLFLILLIYFSQFQIKQPVNSSDFTELN